MVRRRKGRGRGRGGEGTAKGKETGSPAPDDLPQRPPAVDPFRELGSFRDHAMWQMERMRARPQEHRSTIHENGDRGMQVSGRGRLDDGGEIKYSGQIWPKGTVTTEITISKPDSGTEDARGSDPPSKSAGPYL
jgi:hypothetical protein